MPQWDVVTQNSNLSTEPTNEKTPYSACNRRRLRPRNDGGSLRGRPGGGKKGRASPEILPHSDGLERLLHTRGHASAIFARRGDPHRDSLLRRRRSSEI